MRATLPFFYERTDVLLSIARIKDVMEIPNSTEYFGLHKLCLNAKKSNILHFHWRRSIPVIAELKIDGENGDLYEIPWYRT